MPQVIQLEYATTNRYNFDDGIQEYLKHISRSVRHGESTTDYRPDVQQQQSGGVVVKLPSDTASFRMLILISSTIAKTHADVTADCILTAADASSLIA